MPLTIPSTAWSSAASSKITFAALPPSSRVSFLSEPASSRWIALPTSVEPVKAILSTPDLTRAAPARVARRERRRDLPRQHQEREVPRNDLARNPERLRPAVRECVLELVRPARVVEEVRGGQRQVDVAGLANRLAAVQGFEHRELARAFLEDTRDPEEVLRALGGGRRRPTVLERFPRSADGEGDVLGPGLRN